MKELLLALFLSSILYWHFNIKSKNKCITLEPVCDMNNINIEIVKFH